MFFCVITSFKMIQSQTSAPGPTAPTASPTIDLTCVDDPIGILKEFNATCAETVEELGCDFHIHKLNIPGIKDLFKPRTELSDFSVCPVSCGTCDGPNEAPCGCALCHSHSITFLELVYNPTMYPGATLACGEINKGKGKGKEKEKADTNCTIADKYVTFTADVGHLKNKVSVVLNGNMSISIDIECGKISPGDTFGPFTVSKAQDKDGNFICPSVLSLAKVATVSYSNTECHCGFLPIPPKFPKDACSKCQGGLTDLQLSFDSSLYTITGGVTNEYFVNGDTVVFSNNGNILSNISIDIGGKTVQIDTSCSHSVEHHKHCEKRGHHKHHKHCERHVGETVGPCEQFGPLIVVTAMSEGGLVCPLHKHVHTAPKSSISVPATIGITIVSLIVFSILVYYIHKTCQKSSTRDRVQSVLLKSSPMSTTVPTKEKDADLVHSA
jgi:hypothetical protein